MCSWRWCGAANLPRMAGRAAWLDQASQPEGAFAVDAPGRWGSKMQAVASIRLDDARFTHVCRPRHQRR